MANGSNNHKEYNEDKKEQRIRYDDEFVIVINEPIQEISITVSYINNPYQYTS